MSDANIYDICPDVCDECVENLGSEAVHHDDMEHGYSDHFLPNGEQFCDDCWQEIVAAGRKQDAGLTPVEKTGVDMAVEEKY